MPARKSRSSREYSASGNNPQSSSGDWLDFLARIRTHFGRYTMDTGGIILIAFSIMTLLALLGLTEGTILSPLAILLTRWLGWGSILIVLAAGVGGMLVLRKSAGSSRVRWGQVIALETAAFLSLALLSILGGNAIERAEAGMDGGIIGWGIAELLRLIFGTVFRDILIITGLIITVVMGFGLGTVIESWLLKIAAGGENQDGDEVQLQFQEQESKPEEIKKTSDKPASRSRFKIPPEFRKTFRIPESSEDKAGKPPPRSEELPPLSMLLSEQANRPDERTINQTAGLIEKTLSEFGIPAQVVGFRVGPTVTQFAVQPGFIKKSGSEEEMQLMKVRVSQIASLQRDLALALSAERIRIEAPVPGRSYVGIEVPNSRTFQVRLRPILEADSFYKLNSPLAIALGRDVSGQAVVADLERMPHLLIAGATGSGKSVCVTAIAACLAMNNTPEDLRMVLIDAKMVELLRFNGLPHLYGKVETNIDRILGVLRWVVVEMEHRYRLLEASRSRNIASYNRKMQRRKDGIPLHRIVVIIDELADLMMSAPDQTEHSLVRLAQMARATGIHLIVATQRPSTDVVTGLIKANFPARLSFSVASGVDSRVILDMGGAESLLGRGDMLFLNPEVGTPIRSQGVMITDQELEKLIAFWQKAYPVDEEAPPWEAIISEPDSSEEDELIDKAISIVRQSQRASASLLQRRLRIGYPRAARLLDQLEELGIVGPSLGGGRERDILIDPDDDDFRDDD